jgi:hypothetical protein
VLAVLVEAGVEGEVTKGFRRSVENLARAVTAGGSCAFGNAMTKKNLFVRHFVVGVFDVGGICALCQLQSALLQSSILESSPFDNDL